jgi:hypothetical protein
MSSEDLRPFLDPTPTIESRHRISKPLRGDPAGAQGAVERAVRLYAVRDSNPHDPYARAQRGGLGPPPPCSGRGWCVAKAILRPLPGRAGDPIRLGFADVATISPPPGCGHEDRPLFWHGYVSIHLEGDGSGDARLQPGVLPEVSPPPLEFDGRRDSIYHPRPDGNRHMEYVAARGEFADVPIDAIAATFREHYQGLGTVASGDFELEVDAENADA